ncbi:hormone-sensitive lipase [Episyrphus balteatus]|uniref:hormone-sensitive lipase n=1 Tax=Episyrphus balteatus TaxID=286459 RepID=UPI0024854E2C|nr:hormone-sensitive lipase [Episyrphus balteatus]
MQCAQPTATVVIAAGNDAHSVNGNGSSIKIEQTTSASLTDITSSIDNIYYKSYHDLENLCLQNGLHFKDDPSERGQRLHAALLAWVDWIHLAKELVGKIRIFMHEYDFDEHTPGNGYRSFVTVTSACIDYGLKILQNLTATRSTMFFRKKFYMKEVESCSQLLLSLCTCLKYLLILREWSPDGDLFAKGEHSAEELFEMGDTINQYCFYGRCLGFQYTDSIRGVLRFISISMAGFSESFYSEDADGPIAKTTRSVWTGSKYFLNPELRARRIVNISQNANVDFCKSFWFLAESELMHKIPSIVGSSIKVNKIIEIPSEPLQLRVVAKPEEDEEFIDIPVPKSHLGPGTVSVRLLSYNRRQGMIGEGNRWRKLLPPSNSILFHCHGGGFVAQSSKSHELYLRDWAVSLNTPILSVDYSLAPEAPFPRALEEVFYAYCWMVKNAASLGTTAERIVCAGDSAGANLCIGVALKCIEFGIRAPDGIFLAYSPTLVSFVPSPARLLCLMDPLLPFGFMMRCLQAYASPSKQIIDENKKKTQILNNITNASMNNITYYLDSNVNPYASSQTSRRTSSTKSPVSSVAENSNWENIKAGEIRDGTPINATASGTDESSDTFASASYHSQTVERTDLLSPEDNSSCVSFESDSQPIVHMPPATTNVENGKPSLLTSVNIEKSDSEHYIDRFVDKYVVDTNSVEAKENGYPTLLKSSAKTSSEENLMIETGKEVMAVESIHGRLNNAVNSISSTLSKYITSSEIKTGHNRHRIQDLRNLDALIARSPSVEFQFDVPKDPFLSPYWAKDDWLAKFPATKILTLDMDPCLDDCVMFAKKLKSLGRPISLDILKGLPHGFLNFTMLSGEAMDGSKHCIKCIKELLNDT